MARAGLDRDAVVAAAAAIADKKGLAALSLKELAKKLKVQPPSLYNHVDNLAALHRELGINGLNLLADRFQSAAVGRSLDEAVIAISHAYRAFVREHPGLYEASMVAAPSPRDSEVWAASEKVLRVVVAVVGGYGLSEEQTIHAVRAIRAALHGFVSLESAGGFGLPHDIDVSFSSLLTILVDGLQALRADPKKRALGSR